LKIISRKSDKMDEKESFVEICRRVYAKGFVSAFEGNISEKIDNGNILITRSGVCMGDVAEKDILEIDSKGNLIKGSGKISTESKLHLYIYKKRTEVQSIIHCHPIYASAFALTNEGLTQNIFPEVILTIGKVPLCEYGTPSTDEVPHSLDPYVDYAWAFLLKNHGVVTIGKSIYDAYYKMETLEHTSKIIFIAKMMGEINELPKNMVEKLMGISEKVYGIVQDKRNVF
jgi:L-fuculose-phosphate aldolase